jgi:hypothetical protein
VEISALSAFVGFFFRTLFPVERFIRICNHCRASLSVFSLWTHSLSLERFVFRSCPLYRNPGTDAVCTL